MNTWCRRARSSPKGIRSFLRRADVSQRVAMAPKRQPKRGGSFTEARDCYFAIHAVQMVIADAKNEFTILELEDCTYHQYPRRSSAPYNLE